MTKQSKIIATEARFPLSKLSLSPLNPRQEVTEAEVIELGDWSSDVCSSDLMILVWMPHP